MIIMLLFTKITSRRLILEYDNYDLLVMILCLYRYHSCIHMIYHVSSFSSAILTYCLTFIETALVLVKVS